MEQPKKLIEVALPIKEISAESVRDKSIRHGHISTLHLWWARRPLPICRAVIFSSLVPDPLDNRCPKAFKDAVNILLGKEENIGDPYKPYDDIPYTAALDKLEDNPRNRLLMFIGRFSEKYVINERLGKKTQTKDQISRYCLINWDSKNDEEIIQKARRLIWISHNASNTSDFKSLSEEFDKHYKEIRDSNEELIKTVDRHLEVKTAQKRDERLENAINAFLSKMPTVFDPFAGGGAIPLEAARLGCRSYGNDLNPIAYIIQKGSVEFPQKFGKPIKFSRTEFIKAYGKEELIRWCRENSKHPDSENLIIDITNRLSYDVGFYCKKLIREAEEELGHFYPANNKSKKPIAYYWARTGICSNPTCRAEVPLLRQFYLVNSDKRKIHLKPIIKDNTIDFEIKNGETNQEGWTERGNLICPCCHNVTDVETLKLQFINGRSKDRLLAVIWEGTDCKEYKLPTQSEFDILNKLPTNIPRPTEKMPTNYTQALPCCTWGIESWGQMFTPRQLLAMNTFISKLELLKMKFETPLNLYSQALITYLGIFINRLSTRLTSFGLWNTVAETLEHPFGRQAIPMILDYPESNPFTDSTGGASNQYDWICKYIENESFIFPSICNNASSGDKEQFKKKSLTAVVTDPPYYDAIAYADLADFFYVWSKKSLGDIYPMNFATPQTPKSEECTALKHHHEGSVKHAKKHFEDKLTQIFDSIEQQTSDVVSIMFAHQSTEAWTTLCNSILSARMNITGSWAINTERSAAGVKVNKAFLSSSVTVSCVPAITKGMGDYKTVKNAIENKVENEVSVLYQMGLRGADLLTACFGKAVGEFGQYEKVEKADGREVEVAELLEMAKESAFNALLKGFNGDDFTKFYIGWLQLFGFTDSNFDDAAKFARVGLTINVSDLFVHNLFIKKGSKQELAGYKERLDLNHRIGEGSHSIIIDFVHKAMALYYGANRNALLAYIAKVAASPENSFWRVITSLCEILPQGSDDYKQASGLLLNKESLIRESKNLQQSTEAQGQLF